MLEDVLNFKYVIAGTGSRELRTDGHYDAIQMQLYACFDIALADHGTDLIIMSGGAEGFDECLAQAAHNCNIPYVLCLPNKGYGRYYWGNNSLLKRDRMAEFEYLTRHALAVEYTMEDVYKNPRELYINGVHSNFLRNQRMVELADGFFVYNPESRGTADCLQRITKAGKPWVEIQP